MSNIEQEIIRRPRVEIPEDFDTQKFVIMPDEGPDYIIAKRYTAMQRTQHWVNAFAMVLFVITGLMVFFGEYNFVGYKSTQLFHVYLGVFIAFWSVALYINILAAEKKFRDVIPTPRDILDLCIIVLCCLGIWSDDKYPHYDYYDPENKKYIMKYHPTQKCLAFMNFMMLILIGATGFVMYDNLDPGKLELLAVVSGFIVDPIVKLTNTNVRFVHFSVFVYFVSSTMIHIYFTMLKPNRERLKGMVLGSEKIPINRLEQ